MSAITPSLTLTLISTEMSTATSILTATTTTTTIVAVTESPIVGSTYAAIPEYETSLALQILLATLGTLIGILLLLAVVALYYIAYKNIRGVDERQKRESDSQQQQRQIHLLQQQLRSQLQQTEEKTLPAQPHEAAPNTVPVDGSVDLEVGLLVENGLNNRLISHNASISSPVIPLESDSQAGTVSACMYSVPDLSRQDHRNPNNDSSFAFQGAQTLAHLQILNQETNIYHQLQYHQQQQQHLQQQLQEYHHQRLHEQPHPQQQQQPQQQHHLHSRTSIPNPNLQIIIPPSLPQKPIIFTTSVGTALTTQAPVPFMTPPASAGSNAVLLNPFKTNNGSTSTVNLSLNNHAATSTCTQTQRDLQDSNSSSNSNNGFRFSSVTGSGSRSEASMDVAPSSQPPPVPPKDIWPAQSLRYQNNFDVIGEREFVSMPLRRNSTAVTGSGSGSTFSSLSSDIQTPISAPMAPCHHYTGGRGGGGAVPGGVDALPGEISYRFPSQSTCPTTLTPTIDRFSYPALQKSRVKADKQKSVASVGEITSYCPHGSDNHNGTSSTSVTWTHKHASIIQEGTIPDRLWNEGDSPTSMHTNDSPILADFPVPPVQTNSSSIDLSGQKSIEKGYKGRCRETQGVDTMVHGHHPNRPSQRNGAAVFEGKTVVPRRILLSTQQFDSHLPFQGTIHLPQDPAAACNPQCHQYHHGDLSRTSIHDPDPRNCLLDVEAQTQAQVNTETEAEAEIEGETSTEDWSLQEQQYHLAELQKRSYGHVQVPQSERTGGNGSSSGSGSGSGSGGEVKTSRRESKMSQYSTSRKSYLDDYRAQQKLLQPQPQQQQQQQ